MSIQSPHTPESHKPLTPTSTATTASIGDAFPATFSQTVPMDPTGSWTKWLREGGLPLMKDIEVMEFLENMKKALNDLIRRQTKAAKRATDAWKKSLREHR